MLSEEREGLEVKPRQMALLLLLCHTHLFPLSSFPQTEASKCRMLLHETAYAFNKLLFFCNIIQFVFMPSSIYPVVILSRQLDIAYFSLSPSCFKRTVNSTRLCLSQNGVAVHDGFKMAAF